MRTSKLLLLAVLLHGACAARQADGQAPATVVISAPRPVDRASYEVTEARIRKILARQPALSSPFLSWCMENQFILEEIRTPQAAKLRMDHSIRCARAHIEANDKTLRQGLEAFDQQEYAAALGLFRQAYAKMGTQDAAVMLAKMHLDGLGTPKDKAEGMKWLREVAEDRFDPRFDWMRFDPRHPQAMNARIEAAMMLARIYERGDGVTPDPEQAAAWYAKAAEFGFVPAQELQAMAGHAEGDATPREERGPVPNRIAEAPIPSAAPEPSLEAPATVARAPVLDRRAPAAASSGDLAPVAVRTEASNPIDPGGFMVVRVTGLRAVPWKSYRALRAALAAYEKYKPLAPDAVFKFAVMPAPGGRLPPNFQLRVRTRDGREFPIELEHGELFKLPVLPDPTTDADLVSNLQQGQLRIGLLVHTRSVPPEEERLGDVRLRAEMNLAIADVDHPSDNPACARRLLRGNDCKHPRFDIWHKPRAPTSGAWLVYGNRREALRSDGDPDYPAYSMPINAGHLGNDTIIEFDYKRPLPPLTLSEVAIYNASD